MNIRYNVHKDNKSNITNEPNMESCIQHDNPILDYNNDEYDYGHDVNYNITDDFLW